MVKYNPGQFSDSSLLRKIHIMTGSGVLVDLVSGASSRTDLAKQVTGL